MKPIVISKTGNPLLFRLLNKYGGRDYFWRPDHETNICEIGKFLLMAMLKIAIFITFAVFMLAPWADAAAFAYACGFDELVYALHYAPKPEPYSFWSVVLIGQLVFATVGAFIVGIIFLVIGLMELYAKRKRKKTYEPSVLAQSIAAWRGKYCIPVQIVK